MQESTCIGILERVRVDASRQGRPGGQGVSEPEALIAGSFVGLELARIGLERGRCRNGSMRP